MKMELAGKNRGGGKIIKLPTNVSGTHVPKRITREEVQGRISSEASGFTKKLAEDLGMPDILYELDRLSFSSEPDKESVQMLAAAARIGVAEPAEERIPEYGISIVDGACTLVDKKRGIRIIGHDLGSSQSQASWLLFHETLKDEIKEREKVI